jgi:hypothetical protein
VGERGAALGKSTEDMVKQYSFSLIGSFLFVFGGGMERFFQWLWWWREGMLQALGTGQAYQQELLHLKDRSVLMGISCLKNALPVEMHLVITD